MAAKDLPQIDFKIVCENLYEAVHITDGEGRILFVNCLNAFVYGDEATNLLQPLYMIPAVILPYSTKKKKSIAEI